MEPAQTPAEIRETLEGTQKGGVKNSIRNRLTVFQRDPLFRGALRLNLLTEQIDIVKPLGWERTSTTPVSYTHLVREVSHCNRDLPEKRIHKTFQPTKPV